MSARSIASGTISFGLVSIPVKLYSATQQSAGISFNMLHKKDGARLKQQYICSVDQEIVSRDEMAKGYEFAKDQYVIFTPEELKAVEAQSSQSIEIEEFVPLEKVDPIYFDKPYYLGPDKGGDKAYSLLAEVMRRTGRSALARYAARGKQYLVLLRPKGPGLVMQQLLYTDEVRDFSEVPLHPVEVREQEVKLAMQLVDQIAAESFHPEKYDDEVRKRILALVEQKVAGQQISVVPEEKERGQIIDIMEALKASLGAPRPQKAPEKPEKPEKIEEKAEEAPARKPPKRAAGRGASRTRAQKK